MPRLRRALVLVAVLAAVLALRPMTADAVVGGTEVPQGTYEFMAAVLDDGNQICGGTVIAERWVLTAAHCVPSPNRRTGVSKAKGYSVRVGNVDWEQGRSITVDQIFQHDDYDDGDMSNDAALLHLAEPAGVPAIDLSDAPADDDLEAHGAPVTVAGWGSEAPVVGLVPPTHSRLQEADLTVVGDDECFQDLDAETQVCAESFLADSCQGDSGGPLFATKDGRFVQVGVVSYGFGCAVPEFPGVYSEVNSASIRAFIRDTAGV